MPRGQRTVGYVPAYSDLTRHDKTKLMAQRLGMKQHGPQAVAGYLVTLWNRCAQENVPTPDGGPLAEESIEFWAEWMGKRGAFLTAAMEAGYIERHEDGRLYLHDWEHGGGRIVAARDRWRRNKTPDESESRDEFRAEVSEESTRKPPKEQVGSPRDRSDLIRSEGSSNLPDPERVGAMRSESEGAGPPSAADLRALVEAKERIRAEAMRGE